MEQRVQCPANPEVLLDILGGRAEPRRGGIERAQHRLGARGENLIKRRVHVFDVRLAARFPDKGAER
jgi:hypothetical protein